MLTVPGLVDTFTDRDLDKNFIATCESTRNSYRCAAHVKKNVPGQRIDYILYHPGSRMQVEVKRYNQPLPDRVPNHSYSYSDHEAIESTLVIRKRSNPLPSLNIQEKRKVLEISASELTKALNRLVYHQLFYSLFAIILFAMLLLSLAFNSPLGYPIIFNIVRIFITILIIFCVLMATIWNKMEKHGILAGKLAIELTLKQFQKEL